MESFIIDGAVQKHGKIIEDQVKAAFSGASDYKRTQDAEFDIEAKFDKTNNLPTSIKTSKNNTICLADARRVWSINEDFRLIIVSYTQNREFKIPKTLFEFIITQKEWNILKGDMPFEAIEDFHNSFNLSKFPLGSHSQARIHTKEYKNRLTNEYSSQIVLNPKVDSKTQRRLQASIGLNVLLKNIQKQQIIESGKNNFISYKNTSIAPVKSLPRNGKLSSTSKSDVVQKIIINSKKVKNICNTHKQLELIL